MAEAGPLRRSLMGLLLLVALVLHYPQVPRETGVDSFLYLSEVNALLGHGGLFWAVHPAALYGLYPGTTPAGGLTLVATARAVTGLETAPYIWFHGQFVALLALLGFWLLAGELGAGYRGRWVAAFAFTAAPRYLMMVLWTLSIRYLFVAYLPFFFWALVRCRHPRHGRHPARLALLAMVFGLTLPAMHRLGLLLPALALAFVGAALLHAVQERAVNRHWIGRITIAVIGLVGFYFFILQYHGFSDYAPSTYTFSTYLFKGDGALIVILNLGLYYGLTVGPMLLLGGLGLARWFQQGRLSAGAYLTLLFIAGMMFIITDRLYMTHLLALGLLLTVAPGVAMLGRGLAQAPHRLTVTLVGLVTVAAFFSAVDLDHRLAKHENPVTYYSYHLRDTTLNTALWSDAHLPGEIFECNDGRRVRQVDTYSRMVALKDADMLPLEILAPDDLNLSWQGWVKLYRNQYDNLWDITNNASLRENLTKSRTVTVVNLAFPFQEGQASNPGGLRPSVHYRALGEDDPLYRPWNRYRLYVDSELAIYWSAGF